MGKISLVILKVRAVDVYLLKLVRRQLRTPLVQQKVATFSKLGEHGAVWFALGGVGWLLAPPEQKRAWRRATASVAKAYATNTVLKATVRRHRPQLSDCPPLTKTPTMLSFPSAHATTSFAAARAYAQLLPAAPLYVLAVPLAVSRIALAVHYPSDVVAGAALGSLLGR